MMKRDQVNDIFRDNAFNNEHKYNDSNFNKRQILYRFSSRIFRKTSDRIRCILSLGLAKGILYPLLILKRIELSKKLFIMDLDSSYHVFLDKDLSHKKYPMSFRYYDFIISFTNENFSTSRRDYFRTKK
jgi:hypothetical protein